MVHLCDSTMGMSGAALQMGVTALCSNPVSLVDTSSGARRMLKLLICKECDP